MIRPLIAAAVLTLTAATGAAAQDRPAPAIDVFAGWTGFADDGVVTETPLGLAARWYLTPRLSVGPEFTHISGQSHSHQVLTGNLMFDVIESRPGRLIPFLVAGGGWFGTTESFPGETYRSGDGAFTVGGGVRYFATNRVSLGVDARIGWEPHLRVTGLMSVHLGNRP